jgi:hypothetical protein
MYLLEVNKTNKPTKNLYQTKVNLKTNMGLWLQDGIFGPQMQKKSAVFSNCW